MGFFMEFSTLLQDCKANKVQVKNEVGHFHLLFNNLLAVESYKQEYGVLKCVTCWLFAHESGDLSQAETKIIVVMIS